MNKANADEWMNIYHNDFVKHNIQYLKKANGNGRIEADEECDAGFNGDHCCSSQCKLQSGAICSPMNHECCDNKCRTADNNTICHALPDNLVTCKGISKCKYPS